MSANIEMDGKAEAIATVIKVLRESGLVRWNEPDWAVRELAEDILQHLAMASDTSDAHPKEAAAIR